MGSKCHAQILFHVLAMAWGKLSHSQRQVYYTLNRGSDVIHLVRLSSHSLIQQISTEQVFSYQQDKASLPDMELTRQGEAELPFLP